MFSPEKFDNPEILGKASTREQLLQLVLLNRPQKRRMAIFAFSIKMNN